MEIWLSAGVTSTSCRTVSYDVHGQVFGPTFGPRFFANFRTEANVRSVLKQVYTKDVVDDDLVNM